MDSGLLEFTVPALRFLHVNKQLFGRKNTTAENGQTQMTVTCSPQVQTGLETVHWIALMCSISCEKVEAIRCLLGVLTHASLAY